MAEKYNIGDLKTTVTAFEAARRGLSQGTDVFGNMEKLKHSVVNMEPLLKTQTVYIKRFMNRQQPKSDSEKAGEFKRQFHRFCDLVKNEFFEIMEQADSYFCVSKKEKKETWVSICKEYEAKLNALRDRTDTTNFFEQLFGVLNSRDFVYKQMMRSLMYRKQMLWTDIGIDTKQYVHDQSKKLMELIHDKQDQLGYAPTKLQFTPPTFEDAGSWTLHQHSGKSQESTLAGLIGIFNSDMQEVEDIVKNYSKLNEQPELFEDINRNSKIIKGFRQKIQVLSENYALLLQRYREANIKNEDKEDNASLRLKVDQYEAALFQRQIEINEMKQEFKGSSSIIASLKEKVKQQEAEITKTNNYELAKLRELELVQNTLLDEFYKIKKEIGNYSVLYKLENESKKEIVKEIDSQQTLIDKLVDLLGKEKNKSARLQREIARLNELIIELGGNLPD